MNIELPSQSWSSTKQGLRCETRLPARCVRFGPFQLDAQKQELWKDGEYVKVQGKVYQALVALLEHPGEIVTREALRARMWARDAGLNYDANVNTTVNKLRGILGDSDETSRFIETIPRKGYSFVAKVEYMEAPTVSSMPQSERDPKGKTWFFRRLNDCAGSGSERAKILFTAGVIALVIAAILFGAIVALYSRHHQPF
jgi:DNA-binding winged helix-turn-helix (wHTH) protein